MDASEDKCIRKRINEKLNHYGIITRPNAGHGLWLSVLLMLSYMVNTWNPSRHAGIDYKLTTIITFGLFLQTLQFFLWLLVKTENIKIKFLSKFIPVAITTFLIWICLNEHIIFCILSAFTSLIFYEILYFYILKRLPRCFTLGEACIVVQGFIIFSLNTFLQLPENYWGDETTMSDTTKINTILQIGLLGVTIIVTAVHTVNIFKRSFFFTVLLLLMSTLILIFPVAKRPAVFILLEYVFQDFERIFVMAAYGLLLAITTLFVIYRVNRNQQTNTGTRKVFHLLIVLVYVPGLIYQCTFLYLASGIMLAVFIVLEILRVLKYPGIHVYLDVAVKCFVDEKDAGGVALTPIYLLVGLSLPIWLHPSPCDITDSAGIQLLMLLSGALSVGIGDTAASVIGYRYGKHKWSGSVKSIEGTVACIVSQILFLAVMTGLNTLQMNQMKMFIAGIAILANSFIETMTDQVDNLILPLITFIILAMV